MQQNGLVGFSYLQIEIVIVGPPRPPHLPPTTATTLSLHFSAVIAINNDTSPFEIQSKSCRIRRRRDFCSRFDRMSPRSFKGEDFWEGGDGYGDGDEDEVGKWKGWRRRRGRDGRKWRRRRRYSEEGASQDAFWMFRVLRPYGRSLPLILLSWLAASGPKAFFLPLAFSFVLSAAALVVRYLWLGIEVDSQGGDSKRKRSLVGLVSRGGMLGGQNDEKRSGQKHASSYNSWLKSDLGLGLNDLSFGGWVNLREETFLDESAQVTGKQWKVKIESGKRSRPSLRETEAGAPLLLRLLVAMFPFVASWTRLFW